MRNVLKTRWLAIGVSVCILVLGCFLPMQNTATAHTKGTISEFPDTYDASDNATAVDGHGNLWLTYTNLGWTSYIVRITPEGVTTPFVVGLERFLGKIILGPDGNMWAIGRLFRDVERITPDGVVTSFVIGSAANGRLIDIVAGKDGNIWVSEGVEGRNQIARITPEGVVTLFPLPAPYSGLRSLSVATDGSIWFTAQNIIGRVDTTGTIQEFPVWSVDEIVPDSKGGMWFTSASRNRIGKISPNGAISSSFVPNVSMVISDGKGGAWLTESSTMIGHIEAAGYFSEFSVSSVTSMVSDGKRGLWFTEDRNMIGHMSQHGDVTENPLPSVAHTIIPDVDGDSLWFTEQSVQKIGRITF